jgi:hypothetical protein
MVDLTLTQKDIEKLKLVRKSINDGLACTVDKNECISSLDGIIEPKCCVCRRVIVGELMIVNERKMHAACRSRYKG